MRDYYLVDIIEIVIRDRQVSLSQQPLDCRARASICFLIDNKSKN